MTRLSSQSRQSNSTLLTLLGMLGLCYWLYSAAFGAEFCFDDILHLAPLKGVSDLPSALEYVFTGTAGPLGRPIALASFALQFTAWPYAPEEFLYTNVLIHLINGLLVFWMGLKLARPLTNHQESGEVFALVLVSLWVLQPILASSSLMTIQRMVTLSSTFMLAGLIGYLSGRERITQGCRGGWCLMVGSLIGGTILASFTKETGALLPVYVWVLENTILADRSRPLTFRTWKRILYLPTAMLVAYGIWHLPGMFEETQRGFSPYQRLLTESRILWVYLRLIFLPRAADLGPYHDDYEISDSSIQSIMALLPWLAVAVAAVKLRKRFPWFSFAVGWYLLGHSLESTIFNLELYFEHRNYLPSLGPLAWLSSLVWTIPPTYRRVAGIALLAYLFLLGFVLHEVTLAWGRPALAATLWAEKHPRSERAQQFLAQRYVIRGMDEKALQIIQTASNNSPTNAGLALQVIQMRCATKKDISKLYEKALLTISSAPASFSALDAIDKLIHMVSRERCPGLDEASIHSLNNALLKNPRFRQLPLTVFNLHHLEARLFLAEGNFTDSLSQLEEAERITPDIETLKAIVDILVILGRATDAMERLEKYKDKAPKNPFLNRQWLNKLDALQTNLRLELDKQFVLPIAPGLEHK